jgi:hypothetical protein
MIGMRGIELAFHHLGRRAMWSNNNVVLSHRLMGCKLRVDPGGHLQNQMDRLIGNVQME